MNVYILKISSLRYPTRTIGVWAINKPETEDVQKQLEAFRGGIKINSIQQLMETGATRELTKKDNVYPRAEISLNTEPIINSEDFEIETEKKAPYSNLDMKEVLATFNAANW